MLLTYVVKLAEGKTLADLVDLVNDAVGRGTNETFTREEEAFAYSNTPVQLGWLRVPADEPFILDLQWLMQQPTMQALMAEVVEQMWLEEEGQKMVEIGTDENGHSIHLGFISNAKYFEGETT